MELSKYSRTWTYGRLARELRDKLSGEYDVMVSPDDLLLQLDGKVFARLNLASDSSECLVLFSTDCTAAVSANVALLINDVIPTYVDTDHGFTAERVGGSDAQSNH